MRAIIAALTVAALCGAAAPAAQKKPKEDPLARALAGKVAGKPANCIDPQFADGPQIIDSHTILYREGRRTWRNDVIGQCPSLRPMGTLIVKMYGSQLCRNDTFRVLDAGSRIPGSICRFGSFTPYEAPKGAK